MFRTMTGAFVDEANLFFLQFVQSLVGVGNGECDVMDTLALVLDELRDGALRAGGLQKLDLGLTNLEEGGLHFLVGDLFDVVAFHS